MSEAETVVQPPHIARVRPFVPRTPVAEPPRVNRAPCKMSAEELNSAELFFQEASRVLWIGGFPHDITDAEAARCILDSVPEIESLSALKFFNKQSAKNSAAFAFAVFRCGEDACGLYQRTRGNLPVILRGTQCTLRLSHSKRILEIARDVSLFLSEGEGRPSMIAETAVDVQAARINYRLLSQASVRQILSFIEASGTQSAFLKTVAQSERGGFVREATEASAMSPPPCSGRELTVPHNVPTAGSAA